MSGRAGQSSVDRLRYLEGRYSRAIILRSRKLRSRRYCNLIECLLYGLNYSSINLVMVDFGFCAWRFKQSKSCTEVTCDSLSLSPAVMVPCILQFYPYVLHPKLGLDIGNSGCGPFLVPLFGFCPSIPYRRGGRLPPSKIPPSCPLILSGTFCLALILWFSISSCPSVIF